MSEVGAPYRRRLLQLKHDEQSRIVTSRKRKLRELFAVCDNEGPIPEIPRLDPNAPPTTSAEAQFLEACDILQDRPFNESNLPTRRQLRSDSRKQKSPNRQPISESTTTNVSNKIEHYFKRDTTIPRKSRGTTPINSSNEGRDIERNGDSIGATPETTEVSIRRSSSKSSQTILPTEPSADLEAASKNTSHSPTTIQKQQHEFSNKDFEIDRIKRVVESPPGSPGVDPRKAVPPSAEDVANLQEPVLFGANDENHHAATAHLPPKEAQEARLEDVEKAREHKGEQGRHLVTTSLRVAVDLASSPSSTIDAHSTTTPAHHDASTDTSPENDNTRYEDLERPDNENDVKTPTESKSIRDANSQDEHSKKQKTQNEVHGSSPMAADAQLRMEDQAASSSEVAAVTEIADSEAPSSQDMEESKSLAREVRHVEKDAIAEKSDESADIAHPNAEGSIEKSRTTPKENEVPDSEGEEQTPPDAMDLDVATVKDSFESKIALDKGAAINSNVPGPAEEVSVRSSADTKTPPSGTPTSTIRRTPSSTSAPVQLPKERMTTRVASGAIRHKSVSEILGETPVPNTPPASARSPTSKAETGSAINSPSRGSTPGSPRSLFQKTKEKSQSRLSTVVFAKKPSAPKASDPASLPRDFREERKWKMAVAKNLAFACAEWIEASPEERKYLQVTRPSTVSAKAPKDIDMSDETNQLLSHSTPELIASAEADSPMDDVDEELRLTLTDTVSPTAIFGLQDDDVVFGLSRSPATDKLLEELPLYGAPLSVPRNDLPTSEIDPDRFWKRPAVAISKYVEGRMELKFQGPPRKKSRFEYEEDSEDEDTATDQPGHGRSPLQPEQTNIGLFDPANKHIRDRIHAGHQFRPPSEFPMPMQNFFEHRAFSQWTSYNNRMEAAQRHLQALANQAPQQANANGQIIAPRRRTTSSQRVEKRRNQKHLTLVDAMRKLAKKRESSAQKQQLSAAQAAARRPAEQPQQWVAPIKTPQEFSRLKHDRDEAMRERIAAFQQREQNKRQEAQLRQRNATQQQVHPNVIPQQRVPGLPNGLVPPIGQPNGNGHLAVPGQNRPSASSTANGRSRAHA
ncbi:hypothetical protein DID88_008698 [Monilinia fructigena]|uniref:Uncharacterized protein n=1 Tax=Monilinia fructigena TaxID=38457 RepID=A0A395J777_9HELO|nr:hypothetical protein DID88_008698 [Monilinia fructigena]